MDRQTKVLNTVQLEWKELKTNMNFKPKLYHNELLKNRENY